MVGICLNAAIKKTVSIGGKYVEVVAVIESVEKLFKALSLIRPD